MAIRAAKPSDIDAVYRLGLNALESDPFDGLLIDKNKVRQTALACVSSAKNFCMVSEVDGEIVAAVSAIVHQMMFYERQQASVVQFYAEKPGEGVKLIRELFGWWKSRPGIKMLCFTIECGADPRIIKLLQRLGCKQELPVMMAIK